jgi:hypothetical protein
VSYDAGSQPRQIRQGRGEGTGDTAALAWAIAGRARRLWPSGRLGQDQPSVGRADAWRRDDLRCHLLTWLLAAEKSMAAGGELRRHLLPWLPAAAVSMAAGGAGPRRCSSK